MHGSHVLVKRFGAAQYCRHRTVAVGLCGSGIRGGKGQSDRGHCCWAFEDMARSAFSKLGHASVWRFSMALQYGDHSGPVAVAAGVWLEAFQSLLWTGVLFVEALLGYQSQFGLTSTWTVSPGLSSITPFCCGCCWKLELPCRPEQDHWVAPAVPGLWMQHIMSFGLWALGFGL